ncbi:MAG: PH domain-containing protein [Oleiphilaceae bacterium]|nr:PH domain-containing protein [Oleiphilaceae bacterium]
MMTESVNGSGQWQRISPLSMIHHLLQFLRQLAGSPSAFAGMAAAGYAFFTRSPQQALGLITGVLLLGLLCLVASWLRFGYRVHNGAIQVRRGVLTRQRLTLQMERIQTLRLEQPPYLRPFGLVRLSIESAGSGAQEVHLAGIHRDWADRIRQQALSHGAGEEASPDEQAPPGDTTATRGETLLTRRPGDLIRYGISSPLILWGALVVGSLLSAALRRLEQNGAAEQQLQTLLSRITDIMPLWAAYLSILCGLIGLLVVFSIALTLLRYSGYRLQRQGDRYIAHSGLFTRREQMLRQHKIQHLSLNQNAMARLLGRRHLQCHQIGLDTPEGPESSRHLTAPALDLADQTRLMARFQPGLDFAQLRFHRVSPRLMLPTLALWLPLWALGLAGTWLNGGNGLLLALWLAALPLIPLMAWLKWRRTGWVLHNGYLVLRRGLVGVGFVSFAPFRAQKVTLAATPLQRRRGLCNLIIGLSSGAFMIPCLEERDATALMDHLLAEMISSRASWL